MTPGGASVAPPGARGFAFGHARSREQRKTPPEMRPPTGYKAIWPCLPMRASYTPGPSPVSTGVQRRSHLLCKSSIMPKNQLVKGKRTGYTEMQQDSHYLTLRPRKRAKNCKGPKTGRTTPARRWPSAHPLDFDCKTLHFPAKARKRARGEVSEGGAAQPAARPLTFTRVGHRPGLSAHRQSAAGQQVPPPPAGRAAGYPARGRGTQPQRPTAPGRPRAEGTERANGSGPGARRRRTAAYVAAQGARALPPHRRGRQVATRAGTPLKPIINAVPPSYPDKALTAPCWPRRGPEKPQRAPASVRGGGGHNVPARAPASGHRRTRREVRTVYDVLAERIIEALLTTTTQRAGGHAGRGE